MVGVGDSVTAAYDCDCSGFVADYAALMQRSYGVRFIADQRGVNGATTTSLLPSLTGSGATARAIARADVVSVTIGANDLNPARRDYDDTRCGGARNLDCFTDAVALMRAGLVRDLAAIRRQVAGRPVQILVNDYWNVFEDGRVALAEDGPGYLRDSTVMTRLANRAICSAAAEAGAVCVDTFTPYKGISGTRDPTRLLARDGNHPNRAGHLLIAEAMVAAGLPALLGNDR